MAENNVFVICEQLVANEQYHQALALLEPLKCLLSTWMKGKIYMKIAQGIDSYGSYNQMYGGNVVVWTTRMETEAEDLRMHYEQHVPANNKAELETCEKYLIKGEYDRALAVLQPLDCILSTWVKGKINLEMANNIVAKSGSQFRGDDAQKEIYYNLVDKAYKFFCRTREMLPRTSVSIRDLLSPTLRADMARCEEEMIRTKPIKKEVEEYHDYQEEEIWQQEHHKESMVDELESFGLTMVDM